MQSGKTVLVKTTGNLQDKKGRCGASEGQSICSSLPREETPLVASAIASTLATVLLVAAIVVAVGSRVVVPVVAVGGGGVIPVGGDVVAIGSIVVAVGVAAITANSKLDARLDVKRSPHRK